MMISMSCIVWLTFSGQTESFPFPTYREAVRFTESVREGFDIPDEVKVETRIECDPVKENAWKQATKRKGKK